MTALVRPPTELALARVEGMAHMWPRYFTGSELVNETIWQFFTAHARSAVG
jgi:poly(3-hydroxybutyrate) depolymerase